MTLVLLPVHVQVMTPAEQN
uniref:Uncharacterized protein n=1 Tax=Anguilla anguilla TaxID=7936 RepID=A0A0E9TA06_ANGAN